MSVTHFHNTFLERSYELDGIEGIVKLYIGKPQEVSETEWYCEYQIVGIGDELIKKTRGIDSIQALLHALHISPILLRTLAGKEYKITFLGDDELMHKIETIRS